MAGRFNKPKDPRGGHARVYWDIIDSNAFRALSWSDKALYLILRRKLSATNNGNIEATIATLRHYGVASSATLAKSLRALSAVGLITKTRQGLVSQGRQMCSLYRFTDEVVYEMQKQGVPATKATNEWRQLKSLSEATAALAAAHRNAKIGPTKPVRKNAPPVQSSSSTGSEAEAIKVATGSGREGALVIPFKSRSQA